jgi:drug/metabolite transporter (DMT)-like permease
MRPAAVKHARAQGSGVRGDVVNSAPRIAHRPPAAATFMHALKGILLKLVSVLLLAVMSALIRGFGDVVPVGQVVFFRSAFAILPVVVIYAWRRELGTAVRAPDARSDMSAAASSASSACS